MMNRVFPGVKGATILVLLLLLSGADQCPQEEVCDGIDNDGDGLVDEDFDLDGDGYLDADACELGDDCNDQDATIHPGAGDPVDGIDNDCDGEVDEPTRDYTLYVLDAYTYSPMEGVRVLLGMDGTGPHGVTDAQGEVTFALDSPRQDVTVGLVEETEPSEGDKLLTYQVQTLLDFDLDDGSVLYVWPTHSSDPERRLEGQVAGVNPSLAETTHVVLRAGMGALSDWMVLNADLSTVPYEFWSPYQDYLFAAQVEDDADGWAVWEGIPLTFDLVLYPAQYEDLSLQNQFDQVVTFDLHNIDPTMVMTHHYERIYLAGTSPTARFEFQDMLRSLEQTDAWQIRTPPLNGPLAGADLYLSAVLQTEDGLNFQRAFLPWAGGQGVLEVDLPDLFEVDLTESLKSSTVPGSRVEITGDAGSDYEWGFFTEASLNADGSTVINRSWTVRLWDPDLAVAFPVLPPDADFWPDNADLLGEDHLVLSQYTGFGVYHGSSDDTPGYVSAVRWLSSADTEGQAERRRAFPATPSMEKLAPPALSGIERLDPDRGTGRAGTAPAH